MAAAVGASPRAARGWNPPRVPPSFFAIAFGIAGLAQAWHTAERVLHPAPGVANGLYIVSAAAWVVLLLLYLAQGPRRILADARDPVLGAFVGLAVISPMIMASALASVAFTAGRVLVVVFLAATIAVGGWLTGQWIVGDVDMAQAHPGYFLPTVAGGLVGAYAADLVGLRGLAEASFGVGVACWLLLGSTLLTRLFFAKRLPPPLIPALAIEVAPPAVGGVAYFQLTGGATNLVAYALAGYAVLMVVVQLRLLPLYLGLKFSPGFWAFTFSYAALASLALDWIALRRPSGSTGLSVLVLVLITVLVGVIAIRTAILAARGRLFPPWPAQASAGTDAAAPGQAQPALAQADSAQPREQPESQTPPQQTRAGRAAAEGSAEQAD